MDGIGQTIWIMLAISVLRGITVFACFWIIFERFFSYRSRKWDIGSWFGIIFYIAISLLYRFALNSEILLISRIMLIIHLIRIIPFLWAKYGFDPKFLVMVLFYENMIDCLALNVEYLFVVKSNIEGYKGIESDFSIALTEIVVLLFLLLLVALKKANILRVYFTELTIPEYIILFLNCFFGGILQCAILKEKMVVSGMRTLSYITYALLVILIMHVIMVREQNTSMNDMIGNLREPMKQITDSYIEMNEKNTELRRFRHDTKNLLLALRSLAMDGKTEQVVEYIDEMQDVVDTSRVKAFDTGNFIADALLESKAKTASQNGIIMTVEGNIPANRIEDVNLVILISNLVDNAIEAAKQVEGEKKIEIQSILKKNIWILSVKNSCLQDVVIRENRIETTKEEKESHGFGISNIERVAKKYGGNLKLSCENRVFTARATLMLMA